MRLPQTINQRCAVMLISFFAMSGFAHAQDANTDHERETLAKISYEIERLKELASEAGLQSTQPSRVKFRFDWLVNDLDLVKQGIERHLQQPRQAREIKPLAGDYRR